MDFFSIGFKLSCGILGKEAQSLAGFPRLENEPSGDNGEELSFGRLNVLAGGLGPVLASSVLGDIGGSTEIVLIPSFTVSGPFCNSTSHGCKETADLN